MENEYDEDFESRPSSVGDLRGGDGDNGNNEQEESSVDDVFFHNDDDFLDVASDILNEPDRDKIYCYPPSDEKNCDDLFHDDNPCKSPPLSLWMMLNVNSDD